MKRIFIVFWIGWLVATVLAIGSHAKSVKPVFHCSAGQASHDKVLAEAAIFIPRAVVTDLTTEQVPNFLKQWNLRPPVSKWKADQIVVAIEEGKPNVVLIFFTKGCSTIMFAPPKDVFNELAGHSL